MATRTSVWGVCPPHSPLRHWRVFGFLWLRTSPPNQESKRESPTHARASSYMKNDSLTDAQEHKKAHTQPLVGPLSVGARLRTRTVCSSRGPTSSQWTGAFQADGRTRILLYTQLTQPTPKRVPCTPPRCTPFPRTLTSPNTAKPAKSEALDVIPNSRQAARHKVACSRHNTLLFFFLERPHMSSHGNCAAWRAQGSSSSSEHEVQSSEAIPESSGRCISRSWLTQQPISANLSEHRSITRRGVGTCSTRGGVSLDAGAEE